MMRLASEFVLTITSTYALSLATKASLICLVAFLVARICRRRQAAIRYLVFATTFAVLLLLPTATAIVPPTFVRVPVELSRRIDTLAVGQALGQTLTLETATQSRSSERVGIASMTDLLPKLWLTLWLLGLAISLAPVAVGLWQLRDLRRRGIPWLEGQALANTLATASGVRRRVEVLLHDRISGPLTCGVFAPTILLPSDSQQWRRSALISALTHEVEHVRRNDWLVHCVSRVVCAAYWFHPLVWMSWRALRLEAECACDDAVLSLSQPEEYASLLIKVAERDIAHTDRPVLAMASRGDLSKRVAALMNPEQRRGRAGRPLLFVSIAAAASVVAVIAPVAPVAAMQQPDLQASPRFEVASVKPNKSGDVQLNMLEVLPGGRFRATNVPLKDLIQLAYRVRGFQLIDAPGWIESERFDIDAKAEGELQPGGAPPQLRTLLEDRFGLKVRRETKELPIYTLVLANNDGSLGPSLRRTPMDYCAEAARQRQQPSVPPAADVRGRCMFRVAGGVLTAESMPISSLANRVAGMVDRIVQDRTGLEGVFDFDLKWAPDQLSNSDAGGVSLFTALQEQLGLKLQSARGPVDVLVIERVDRATAD